MKKHINKHRLLYWLSLLATIGVITLVVSQVNEDDRAVPAMWLIIILVPTFYRLYSPIRKSLASYYFENNLNRIARRYPDLKKSGLSLSGKITGNSVNINFPEDSSGMLTISTKLPISSPHIYLDGHRQETGTQKSSGQVFSSNNRVSLEGNFDNYMRLYTPHKDIPWSLSILAPDFMHSLVATGAEFDIEMHGNKFTMTISGTDANNGEKTVKIISSLSLLLKHIDELKDSFNRKGIQFIKMKPVKGNDSYKIRQRRLPGRHIVGMILTLIALYCLSWGATRRTWGGSLYNRRSNTEELVIGLTFFIIVGTLVYGHIYLSSMYKVRESKIIARPLGIQITLGWLIYVFILIIACSYGLNEGYSTIKDKENFDLKYRRNNNQPYTNEKTF